MAEEGRLGTDYCTSPPGCGWLRPIEHIEQRGRKVIKLCVNCAKNPVVLKEMGAPPEVTDAFKDVPPTPTPKTPMTLGKRLRAMFVFGVIIGSGLAFAFFNFVRAWTPCP